MDLSIDISDKEKVFLISIISEKFEHHSTQEETRRSLDELQELMRTIDVETCGEFVQNKKKMESATILGSGKLLEIAKEAKRQGVNRLIFDFELTASQMRNIATLCEMEVSDRCQVILQIFAKHARSKESKIQIQISRYQYLLPRLTSMWSHFSKQKGGIGMKGEGEQQLELDRRIIRKRIETFQKQLKEIAKSRKERMKKRSLKSIKAALVGYTNAGKSSLLNRLCQSEVLEENKLFATLDSTYRMLTPDSKPPVVLIDTVGFLSNLPNTLIEGFKTTLESIAEAQLLLIVSDLSDPNFEKHIETTHQVLEELGYDQKEKFYIFNKKDKVENLLKIKPKLVKYQNTYLVSSLNDEDMVNLKSQIIDFFLNKQNVYDLFIPYQEGRPHSSIQKFTNIMKTSNHEKGIYYKVRTPNWIFDQLNVHDFLLSEVDIMGLNL